MTTAVPKKIPATAWVSQNPYLLYVFPESNAVDNNSNDGRAVATTRPFGLSAKSGTFTGCNMHELATLRRVVQAHEEYHNRANEKANVTQALGENDFLDASPTSEHHTLAQSYLNAVRDCLNAWDKETVDTTTDSPADNRNDLDNMLNWSLLKRFYSIMHLSEIYLPLFSSPVSSSWEESRKSNLFYDPLDVAGYVSADTVRYLRLHELCSAEKSVKVSFDKLSAVIKAEYPEQETLYWSFLIELTKRGCLEQAWRVLTLHSLYRADDKELKNGFQLLQQVLLIAPLPGGRVAEYDDRLDQMADDDIPFQVDGLGVVQSDYLLWNSVDRIMGDHTMSFSPHAAIHKFREWHDFAVHVRASCSLVLKCPAIKTMLAILCGDFSEVTFTSWAERFCAELLYCTPDRRPRTMSTRVEKLLRDFGQEGRELSTSHIMNGNAGHAIVALYNYGVGTGVALASTLMALLFSLFVDAGYILPPQTEKKIDFVTEAAYDIQATLHGSQHSDFGVELALRLLLPYASKASEAEAVIANILEHYTPTTTECASKVVSLVRRGLIEENHSIQILDGYTSIQHYLYNAHMKVGNAGMATAVLLEGIELEHAVLPQVSLGACYRTLSKDCHALSMNLLQALSGEDTDSFDVSLCVKAKSIVETMKRSTKVASLVPAGTELSTVVELMTCRAENSQLNVQGHCITKLLSRDATGLHDASSVPIRSSSLNVAKKIITECHESMAPVADSSPFSLHGMSLLMQQQLTSDAERHNRNTTAVMQHGLLQAILADNAKLKTKTRNHWEVDEATPDYIQYAKLSELDSAAQMQFIQDKMLNFM